MAHPVMYDDADPHFQRVSTLALALPQAQMKVSHGRPAFFTQKVFAYYGASVKVEGADVDVLAQDARALNVTQIGC